MTRSNRQVFAQTHTNGGRHRRGSMPDAQACQNIEYSDSRCQLARRCEQDAQHRFAILSGGFVSEAKLSVMGGATLARCPCGQMNNLDHMIWDCQDVPDHSMCPPVPTDWLQRRLAWPSGSPPMMKPPSLGWFMSVGGRLHSGKNPPTNKSLIVNNLTCPFSDKHVRKLLRLHLRVVEAGYHTAVVDNCGVAVRVRPEAVVCHCGCKRVYCCGLPLW